MKYDIIGVIKPKKLKNPFKQLCASVNLGLSGYDSSFGIHKDEENKILKTSVKRN